MIIELKVFVFYYNLEREFIFSSEEMQQFCFPIGLNVISYIVHHIGFYSTAVQKLGLLSSYGGKLLISYLGGSFQKPVSVTGPAVHLETEGNPVSEMFLYDEIKSLEGFQNAKFILLHKLVTGLHCASQAIYCHYSMFIIFRQAIPVVFKHVNK